MLSNATLGNLVMECFDDDEMRQSVIEKIKDLIDYDELATAIVEAHEDDLNEIIIELAEEAVE